MTTKNNLAYDDRRGSGFDATSTTDDVLKGLDLAGRRYLVTGSSGGLGLETVRALAACGATVVMAARDRAKNESAAAGIRSAHPSARLEILDVDLGSLDSVRSAMRGFVAAGGPLHGVVANAGIMATPFALSADGFESQFAVDHLGHFLLVRELLPMLADSAPARVVCVSSAGHRMGDVDLDDLNFERRPYEPFLAQRPPRRRDRPALEGSRSSGYRNPSRRHSHRTRSLHDSRSDQGVDVAHGGRRLVVLVEVDSAGCRDAGVGPDLAVPGWSGRDVLRGLRRVTGSDR
jgi:hypothetical protein